VPLPALLLKAGEQLLGLSVAGGFTVFLGALEALLRKVLFEGAAYALKGDVLGSHNQLPSGRT
jgi:hypothetical protein